jgi:hypothetical protein
MMIRKLLLPAVLLSLALLPGCEGLENDDELTEPSIFQAEEPATCGTAGTTPIELTLLDTQVVESQSAADADWSLLGPHRVIVSGFVTGLPAGHSIYGLVLDDDVDCPVTFTREQAVVGADGSFTLTLRISTPTNLLIERFRVIAVSGPAGGAAGCSAAGDCIEISGAPVGGLSNAIGVRI